MSRKEIFFYLGCVFVVLSAVCFIYSSYDGTVIFGSIFIFLGIASFVLSTNSLTEELVFEVFIEDPEVEVKQERLTI